MSMPRLILALLLSTSFIAQAQDSAQPAKDSTKPSEKIHLYLGAIANSGLNYYGRTDSLKSRAFCPFLNLTLSNGLYATGTAIFINNKAQSEYAASLIAAGYNFHNKNNHWSGNIEATKFIYRQNLDLIQSAIRYSGSASITNSNKIVNTTIAANIKYSTQADYGAQASIDHIQRLTKRGKKIVVLIDPTITGYAGTQHVTNTFYQQKQFLFLPAGQEAITKNSSQFAALACEGSFPTIIAWKKYAAIITPSYIIPQNAGNTPALFYCTATIRYTVF